jgi:hypothetical protein
MPNTASVILKLQDVCGNPATDPRVTVRFHETRGGQISENRLAFGPAGVSFGGLPAFPHSRFMTCWVAPSRYRARRSDVFGLSAGDELRIDLRFVRKASEWKARFWRWDDLTDSFEPLKAVLRDSPDLRVHGGEKFSRLTGAAYNGVSRNRSKLAVAAMLNLFAKMSALTAPAPASGTWFSYVRRIIEIRRDRFLALVDPHMGDVVQAMKKEIKEYADYKNADASLHYDNMPHTEYRVWKTKMFSIKSSESEGNLQLTLARARNRQTGQDVLLLDADIDEKGKLFEHLLEVFGHMLTNRNTHPFDVHEILVASVPRLELGYTLV